MVKFQDSKSHFFKTHIDENFKRSKKLSECLEFHVVKEKSAEQNQLKLTFL